MDASTLGDSEFLSGWASPNPGSGSSLGAPAAFLDDTLDDDPVERHQPQFAPDGTWISCYRLDSTRTYQLYRIEADSGSETPLTTDTSNHTAPRFSADGQWIVYCHDDMLARIKTDGTGMTILDTGLCADPQWSLDGQWIAYDRWTGEHQLRIISADGDSTILLPGTSGASAPQRSPDGHWLAYDRRVGDWHQIWKVSVDSGTTTQLTNDEAQHGRPQWSHDGQWLVYENWVPGERIQLHRVKADGSCEQSLTSGDDYDYEYPSFSSSSQWIVCTRSEDSTAQICLVPAAGGSTTDLTSTPTMKYYPELSPDNEWAAYEEQTSLDNGEEPVVIGRVRTGLTDITGPDGGTPRPLRFEFAAPVPNPAHAGVAFKYALPASSRLTLAVYDATGKLVAKPISGEARRPGWYRLDWNRQDQQGRRVANGVYFCRLLRFNETHTRDSKPEIRTQKLILE